MTPSRDAPSSPGRRGPRIAAARPGFPALRIDRMRSVLLAAAFLSGAAALAYELLWVRELTLLAGSTQAAVSCVLSVYFLGLALGNRAGGRLAGRSSRPLLLYAGVEITIGAWALLFPLLLGRLGGFYGSLYSRLPIGSGWVLPLRAFSAAALLLVPATGMGATLPLLAQTGTRDVEAASRWSGLLYGLNTFGAMAGTFATGFVLVEALGVSLPMRLTAALNLACAILVLPWALRRPLPGSGTHGPAPLAVAATAEGRPQRQTHLLLLSFGVLGFANLALEVLWTSFYALIYPNDTYVFTTLLLLFLFGVAAGSLLGERVLGRVRNAGTLLGLLQVVSAAAILGMIFFGPPVAAGVLPSGGPFSRRLLGYFAGIGAGTILPTLCMGASFPLLVRATLARSDATGSLVGRALAWNTLGGVFGSLVGGFVLLDRAGLQAGLFVCAGLVAAVGVTLCRIGSGRWRRVWVAPAAFAVPLLVAFLGLPPHLPDSLFRMHFQPWTGDRLLETRSSVHGTVAITEDFMGTRRVWINSTWVASEKAHLAFGYAPWLLHPGPVGSALGICCGTGRTFGALLNAGIPDLDLVDINPAVIALSGKWLGRSNHGVLRDPRAHVIIDDGRSFVRYGRKKYDLITLEPLQMFQKGVAYFYTSDFYREARARLQPGGVLCQWVPLYLLDEHQFRSMVRTFLQVFPQALLWGRREHSIVLLGYNQEGPLRFDAAEIAARMSRPGLGEDLAQEELTGRYDPLIYTLADSEGLRALSASGEIYTDDRPTLEFTAPRARYTPDRNLALVLQYLAAPAGLFGVDSTVAAEMEQIRRLTMGMSLAGSDRNLLEERIETIRRRLYAGGKASF